MPDTRFGQRMISWEVVWIRYPVSGIWYPHLGRIAPYALDAGEA